MIYGHWHPHLQAKGTGWRPLTFLAFSTLGVVYGDIGTSPLYVFSSTFPNGAPDDENMILGTFSMIFWTITSVVLVKYVLLMLRADDRGEGGIISLYSLIKRAARVPTPTDVHSQMVDLDEEQRPKSKVASWLQNALSSRRWAQISLLVLVLLAVNMIISDGVLTPAISVISAVEGIQYNTGISNGAVVGITVAILVVLFVAQSFGTQRVSAAFSPIILLWFTANFVIGIYNLVKFRPSAAKGLSPSFIYYYWSGDAHQAWRNLGNVMLSITGAEALYADLGHFSARSIQLSFIAIVYPSLTLTYLGQTAYILENKPAAATAFWSSQPSALYVPMVILATLAAIIASQALITGAPWVVHAPLLGALHHPVSRSCGIFPYMPLFLTLCRCIFHHQARDRPALLPPLLRQAHQRAQRGSSVHRRDQLRAPGLLRDHRGRLPNVHQNWKRLR